MKAAALLACFPLLAPTAHAAESGDGLRQFIAGRAARAGRGEEASMAHDEQQQAKIGDVVKGAVTKITSFGAFVELKDGIDGLVHISQIQEERVDKIKDVLKPGQEVSARVIKIDREGRRIGLSIKAANYSAEQLAEARQMESLHRLSGFVLHDMKNSNNLVVLVPTDPFGRIDLDVFAAEVRVAGTLLASVQHANHEVGTVQQIALQDAAGDELLQQVVRRCTVEQLPPQRPQRRPRQGPGPQARGRRLHDQALPPA